MNAVTDAQTERERESRSRCSRKILKDRKREELGVENSHRMATRTEKKRKNRKRIKIPKMTFFYHDQSG